MEKLKQWELPNNTKVEIQPGEFATFLEMDGMYAKWDLGGKFKIGNYDIIYKEKGKYKAFNK